MKTFSVGPHDLRDYYWEDIKEENYEWVVYWYQDGGYDGEGEAVGLRTDGMITYKDLTHCSCYGPLEGWETGTTKVTIEEWLRPKESIHDLDCTHTEVRDKVMALLATRTLT